jgi:nitroreductase
MNPIHVNTLLAAHSARYATKVFDPSKKIPAETWAALEQVLLLSPSSYGLQPWKFLVVTDPSKREALVPHSWGQRQVADASHLVVFAVKEKMDEAHVDRFIARMAEVRSVPAASLDGYRNMMVSDVVRGPRSAWSKEWAARQAYIALGNFMTSAALLGIDTCPMEGIDPAKYDEILGLAGSGYATVVACPAGYRSEGDKYASQAKVRFEPRDIFHHV